MENQSGYTGLLQPLLDGARLGGWRGDTRRLIFTQVEELDERMQKLTHKLENARRDFVRAASDGRVRRELNESGRALACFDSFVEVGPPQAGTADRCRRGRAEKERERGGGDGEPSEACGLLGLERITLIVLRHRGKYAGCLSRPEYRLDAANAAKNPGV